MSVLIFEGMKVGFLPGDFTLSIHDDGHVESKAILSTSYNTIPLWLRIEKDHVAESRLFEEKIQNSWPSDPDDQKSLLLSELRPSMISIVTCAIAIDALYDLLRPHSGIDEETVTRWREQRTSRKAQVCEILRRSFALKNSETKSCRGLVGQIFDLRDRAIHPSNQLKRSIYREDIGVGVDWRFVAFRHLNANTAFNNTMGMFIDFFSRGAKAEINDELKLLKRAFVENGLLSDAPVKP